MHPKILKSQASIAMEALGTVAHPSFPKTTFESIAQVVNDTVEPVLFSINARLARTMILERVYSSDLQSYNVRGRKDKSDTVFGQKVLIQGQVLRSDGESEIRLHFDDGDRIVALGGKSLLNVPVKCSGDVIGVLNLVLPNEVVEVWQIELVESLAPITALALLGRFQRTYHSALEL